MSLSIFRGTDEIDSGECQAPMVNNTSCFREGRRPMVEDYPIGCHVYVTLNHRNGKQDDQRVISILKSLLTDQKTNQEFVGFLYRECEHNFVIRMWLLVSMSDRQQLTRCLVDIWDRVYSDSRIKSKLAETNVAEIKRLNAHSFGDYKKTCTVAVKLEIDLTSVVLAHLSMKGFISSIRGLLQINTNQVDPTFPKIFAMTVNDYYGAHLENQDLIGAEVSRLLIMTLIIGANTGNSVKGYNPLSSKLESYWRCFYSTFKCLFELKLITPSSMGKIYMDYLMELLIKVKTSEALGELSSNMEHLENFATCISFAIKLHRCDLQIMQPLDHLVQFVDDDEPSTKVGTEIARVFFGELCFKKAADVSNTNFEQMVGRLGGYFMVLLNLNKSSPLQVQAVFSSAMKNSDMGELKFNSLSNNVRAEMCRSGRFSNLCDSINGLLTPIEVACVVAPAVPKPDKIIPKSHQLSVRPIPQPVQPADSDRFTGLKQSESSRFGVFKPASASTRTGTVITTVTTTTSTTRIQQNSSRGCGNCGMSNHPTANCRFPPKDKQTCHKCGTSGHVAPMCTRW